LETEKYKNPEINYCLGRLPAGGRQAGTLSQPFTLRVLGKLQMHNCA